MSIALLSAQEPTRMNPDDPPLLPPEGQPGPLDTLVQPNPIPEEASPPVDQPTLFPRDSAPPRAGRSTGYDGRDVPLARAVPETEIEDYGSGAASAFGFNPGTDGLARPSVAGARAEKERQQIIARSERQASLEHYNFKIGPVPFRFGAGIEFHFTDNANLSSSDKLADISVIPNLNLFGGVRITPYNTLSIQMGVGYLWNLNRTDLNRTITNVGVGLDTDSGINFDFKFGNFHINLYDRPAIPRQQFDLITQRNALQFAQFTNTAGISVFWDANTRFGVNVQYDFLTVIGLASDLDQLNQNTQMLSVSANYRISDSLRVGVQASTSMVNYQEEFLNDATTYNAGINLTALATRNITLSLSTGYQGGSFASSGEIGDTSSLGTWYMQAGINHSINRFLSHNISIGRESQLGTASNSLTTDFVRYQLSANFWRNFGLGGSASFDSAQESGGVFAQEFTLLQMGIFGYWIPSKRLTLSFGYRFLLRDATAQGSDADESLDYSENRVDVSLQINL